MKWGFRWYGAAGDAIPLKHIRQIPGITGVVGTLLNKLPGDVVTVAEIQPLKHSDEEGVLALLGIERDAIHVAV
ncbi:mannonate dehydratase, partial [Enterococcus faecium]|uniref:mannonate dehydratase n=1 Tax=Enterococcus faecium TaxID=1352 RepID=UPI0030C85E9B